MMAERGISIDPSTIYRWVVHFSPVLLDRFNRSEPSAAGGTWTRPTSRVRGQWMCFYRAIDSVGDTVEFWLSEQHDVPSAKRQGRFVFNPAPSLKEQFEAIEA